VTPDNCRRPRLGLPGRLLRSGRAKASCAASIFALLHGQWIHAAVTHGR
jgi:hypothetical protein